METSSEQAEAIPVETGEKNAEAEAPAGEVTTSDGDPVSAGGDVPVSTEGQSSKVAGEDAGTR